MSTKISKPMVDEVKKEIATLLDCGIRFTRLNWSNDELGEFWHKGFPNDLLDAYTILAQHGVGIEYHAVSSSVGFCIPHDASRAMSVRLCIPGGNGGFVNITRAMAKDHPTIALPNDSGGSEPWPVISHEEGVKRVGQAKWDELVAWAKACDTMSHEIANSLEVCTEILDMVTTAGQLKRMVPDLLRFISPKVAAAVDDQKRASSVPPEWAAYDRAKVDAAMVTLSKCDLVKGIVTPDTAGWHYGQDGFSWALLRDIKK